MPPLRQVRDRDRGHLARWTPVDRGHLETGRDRGHLETGERWGRMRREGEVGVEVGVRGVVWSEGGMVRENEGG
ncbi:hypothetical protein Hamer_G025179 [Homarus americanus]|uniref:Uncharacterized protein n=1 Tax=Homarus americanus TaxID=6706 RepID=A0A8J5TSX0_HOMAM|nr:hypothetical protein Hamer_G025179 [Homarus americanus]